MYSITCNCGWKLKDTDRRMVEAKMWHHAVHDHADMIKGMSIEQFADIMKSWDKKFNSQERRNRA